MVKPFYALLLLCLFHLTKGFGSGFCSTDTIPQGFPDISTFQSENAAPGYIYFATSLGPYRLGILDQSGVPVYYNDQLTGTYSNFRYQNDNLYTFADQLAGTFIGMDSMYVYSDTFRMAPGLDADFHDIQFTPSGNVVLMNYDVRIVDMSQVVPGGNPNAAVTGLILQELDTFGNVVFEWQSWDHFEITDGLTVGLNPIDFTGNSISYVHCNSIDIDTDGNWIISSRHMSEVTKINRQTGNVIWRMGGLNNEFTFVNDPLNGFTDQHDARRLANGNLMIFDNGLNHATPTTRVVEYAVDEVNKVATLVWSYENPEGHLTQITGNAQRLENGNTFIFWGRRAGVIPTPTNLAVEVDQNGNTVFELFFNQPGQVGFIYRIFKLPWNEPELFTSIETTSEWATDVRVFPNPASDNVTLEINTPTPGNYDLLVTDVSGRILVNQKITSVPGINELIRLETGNWPAGHYYFAVSGPGGIKSGRILITR